MVQYGFPILVLVTVSLLSHGLILKYSGDLSFSVVAESGHLLTIKHDILTKKQLDFCTYSLSIFVLDAVTKKAIPDSLVEFRTGSNIVITNMTDQNGETEISLELKEPGGTCMAKLLNEGYSIEAYKTGYLSHGTGTIS